MSLIIFVDELDFLSNLVTRHPKGATACFGLRTQNIVNISGNFNYYSMFIRVEQEK